MNIPDYEIKNAEDVEDEEEEEEAPAEDDDDFDLW